MVFDPVTGVPVPTRLEPSRVDFILQAVAATDFRLRNLRWSLNGRGLELPDEAIVYGEFSAESGFAATLDLMRARPDLTSIFAGNDTIALGVIGALASLGLAVPADVSVVGFDDLPFAAFTAPALTTVKLDADRQGRTAAELLIRRLRNLPISDPRIVFKSRFVVRASCAPPHS
jgi:LacI family transcriptional regulator